MREGTRGNGHWGGLGSRLEVLKQERTAGRGTICPVPEFSRVARHPGQLQGRVGRERAAQPQDRLACRSTGLVPEIRLHLQSAARPKCMSESSVPRVLRCKRRRWGLAPVSFCRLPTAICCVSLTAHRQTFTFSCSEVGLVLELNPFHSNFQRNSPERQGPLQNLA
jgi:hypothetical protein